MDNRQRWERVLAAVEADAKRAEALLAQVQQDADAADGSSGTARTEPDAAGEAGAEDTAEAAEPALAVPAEWYLPNKTEAPRPPETQDPFEAFLTIPSAELPPLDQMPPVPAELGQRILTLQATIHRLQDELQQALREWQPVPRTPLARPASRPLFVDRQL